VFEVRTDDTRLVLRVHRPAYRSAAQIRSELHFLQALAPRLRGTRIDVPHPIPTRTGELLVEARSEVGIRHCSLLTWIDGRELKPTRGLGRRAAFLLGEGLARLHAAADEFKPPPEFELPRWDGVTMFTAASPFRPGQMKAFLPGGRMAALPGGHCADARCVRAAR
jgi:Ser/Thr protein kinase RdoA (MazF antagonist)